MLIYEQEKDGKHMEKRKIFLCTNESFGDNKDALSYFKLEDAFSNAMEDINVKYEILNSSCILSEVARAKIIPYRIMISDLCILDITSIIEEKEFANFIKAIYQTCIELDKKMILLHHFSYSINEWLKLAKDENIVGVFEHDGSVVLGQLSDLLRSFFETNQNRTFSSEDGDNDLSKINNIKPKKLELNTDGNRH